MYGVPYWISIGLYYVAYGSIILFWLLKSLNANRQSYHLFWELICKHLHALRAAAPQYSKVLYGNSISSDPAAFSWRIIGFNLINGVWLLTKQCTHPFDCPVWERSLSSNTLAVAIQLTPGRECTVCMHHSMCPYCQVPPPCTSVHQL